jgi:hypothetical protein
MEYYLSDPCHFHRSKFKPSKRMFNEIEKGQSIRIGKYENLISLTQSGDGCFNAYRHSTVNGLTGLHPFKAVGVDAGMIALVTLGEGMKQPNASFIVAEKPYNKVRLHSNGVIAFYNGVYKETIYIDTNGEYDQLRLNRLQKLNKGC